jgi:copper transport protein
MHVVDDRIRWTAITITGIALMGSWAWAGHAKSQRWSWVGVPVDVVHHTAAALWIGALAIVGTTALAALRAGELASVMRRMSTVAAVAVVVIVATGVVQTVRLVGGPAQLFDTTHGRSLVAKLVLVAVMLGLANHHRTRVANAFRTEQQSALAASGLRRTVMAEFALGLAVIGITAAMVVTPPSSAADPRVPSAAASGLLSD